ncbi:MAG: VIT domain-containing protein [Chloroflexota bacterium]
MSVQPNFDDLHLGSALLIQDGELGSPLPLEGTEVSGQIIGPVASIHVTQNFGNPFTTPIEIAYLFPLPHDAAIVDYVFTIGARQVRAEIKEIETARRTYQYAADAGKRASLLEQRRPNLYSIQIANVQPNEKIICKLQYEQRLSYQDGVYEFVFPMGITPRYHSPSLGADIAKSADTSFARLGEAVSGVELQLSLDAGAAIADPVSTTHSLTLERHDDQKFSVGLAGDNIPNKDFVLRYSVDADAIVPAVWSYAEGESEIALINLLPPRLDMDAEPGAREFVFVVDRSGSMSTDPMEQAKNALRACLRALNPQDTFYIQAFDDHIEWLSDQAWPVAQENVDRADSWLNNIFARGGTEILPAIDAALTLVADDERQRYVVFLTDGSVSADEQAIRKIAKGRGSARIFTFGIGPSVNRFLLDKMAQMGRGKAEFVGAKDDLERTITRFQDRVSYPALQDIALDWGYAEAWDTYPDVIPDLYVGEPVQIVTRLKRKGNAHVHLNGRAGSSPVEVEATIPTPTAEDATIGRLWARARIESLLDQQYGQRDSENLRQQIIALALEYRLLTPFTAFVAVDSEVTTGGDAKQVNVSVPLPEGLTYENFFGGSGAAGGGTVFASMAPPPAPVGFAAGSAQAAAPPNRPAPSPMRGLNAAHSKSKVSVGSLVQRINDIARKQTTESDDDAPESPVLNFVSIDERIKWLARTQNVNGSWDDDAEMTAAALLAFVRAGHTTRVGDYRQQVKKAGNWLHKYLSGAKGLAAILTFRALSELETATGDVFISDDLKRQSPQPTTDLEKAIVSAANPPDPVKSLDDLRLAAVSGGDAAAPDDLKRGTNAKLVQIWLAVGKPR